MQAITPKEMQQEAQRLYDKKNFTGITSDEHNILANLKREYQRMTGKELELKYNCPS